MSKMICSICGDPFEAVASPHTPFCSRRCQQIDLGRWLGEEYGMPMDGQEDRHHEHQEAQQPEDADQMRNSEG